MLDQLEYMTKGPGKTACSIGQDVAYPPGAPGFQDDPTAQSTAKVRLRVAWCAGHGC